MIPARGPRTITVRLTRLQARTCLAALACGEDQTSRTNTRKLMRRAAAAIRAALS